MAPEAHSIIRGASALLVARLLIVLFGLLPILSEMVVLNVLFNGPKYSNENPYPLSEILLLLPTKVSGWLVAGL